MIRDLGLHPYDGPSESEICMAESVESVKDVAAFLRAAVEKNSNPDTQARLAAYADVIDSIAEEIVTLRGLTSALPPELGNIHDLPPELLEELSIAKGDDLDDQLVTVINAYGGMASLDQILVGLYRKFKVKKKRRFIQNKLYRMEMIWGVTGRKGVYATSEEMARNEGDVSKHEEEMVDYLGPDGADDLDSDIPF